MDTQQRPKINLRLNLFDWIMESLGWMIIVVFWIVVVYNYPSLPESIPIHFSGMDGHIDKTGSKASILALPVIATVLFLGMTLLNNYPHIFNHPVVITLSNAEKQYRNSTRLIRFIKFSIPLIFLIITFQTIQIASGKAENLGPWILPGLLSLIFVPIFISFIYAFRNK